MARIRGRGRGGKKAPRVGRRRVRVGAADARLTWAWTSIKYPHAVWENDPTAPGGGYWISDAQVAEVPDFTAFTSKRKSQQIGCRLVVRRVRRLQPCGPDGSTQAELLPTWRHHAFITNSTLTAVQADEHHRDHAIIEQVMAELKAGALAHLPSGKYTANAAWLAHTVIAFNLARAAGVAAGTRYDHARWATIREHLIRIPARIATTSRRLTMHLPADWPWASNWDTLWHATTSPPDAATS